MKKLLIAGGGYADIPLIQAGKKLGFFVITSGNRANDLGHVYADQYCPEDFSDKEAMLRLAERERVDAICACSNDFSALSSAYVAAKMGLPGHDSYETSLIIHHKDRYREFAQKHNLLTPRAAGFEHIEEALAMIRDWEFPLIIKPVDLTGGKGISTIASMDEAKQALINAFDISRAKRVVCERFLSGSRHGLSTFLYEGKIVFSFSDNEHYYKNPYMVAAASTPGDVPDSVIAKLHLASERIASLLSLKTGIFHIQYILEEGEPCIIEICRRSPGDLYTQFVEIATGVPYPEWIVKSSAGMDCSDIRQADPQGFFTRHCIMSDRNGTLDHLSIDPALQKNIVSKYIWGKEGDDVTDYLIQKFGIVFLQFESLEHMAMTTNQLSKYIFPILKDPS